MDVAECLICAFELKGGHCTTLPCSEKHQFHSFCLYRVATEPGPQRSKCPLCRTEFDISELRKELRELDDKTVNADASPSRDFFLDVERSPTRATKKARFADRTDLETLAMIATLPDITSISPSPPPPLLSSVFVPPQKRSSTIQRYWCGCGQCDPAENMNLKQYMFRLQRRHNVVFFQVPLEADGETLRCAECSHQIMGAKVLARLNAVDVVSRIYQHYAAMHPGSNMGRYVRGCTDKRKSFE